MESGIVSPIAFAVLRLRTMSNFVACSTGRSGLSAFENPVHKVGGTPIHRSEVFSIGHQTTGLCPPFLLKHAWQPFFYREVDDLASLLHRHRVLQHEERVRAFFCDRRESGCKVLRSFTSWD